MKYSEKGAYVESIQKMLLQKGYSLSAHGADGYMGEETWEALQRFADDYGVPWNPAVPQAVIDKLAAKSKLPEVPEPPPAIYDVEVIDLRHEQKNPPDRSRKFKLSAGKVVKRNPAVVTGITIHQTAVKYGVAPYQIDAAEGNKKLALARRALEVACHVMAFHEGFIVWANPLDWYVYHGNGFNSSELGIEIDGNYPGLIGGKTWNGKKATEVTDDLIKAARAGISLLVRYGRKLGMPIEYIHAHRQSSETRRSDPGEELWKRVVLEYCVPILGLKTEPGKILKNGRTIPKQWDPRGIGDY